VAIRISRRGNRSDSTPAIGVRRKAGNSEAKLARPTQPLESVSSSIRNGTTTFWSQLAEFEMRAAVQKRAKSR